MSKPFTPTPQTPAVITANDLRMGHCVWMTQTGWTSEPGQAALFETQGHADLALLEAEAQAHIVVGPYIAQVRVSPNGPEPTHFREAFRRRGPSNYFHGKQAEAANDSSRPSDSLPRNELRHV